MHTHNYFVYITTNFESTVLYIGVTNNLIRRLEEHQADSLRPRSTFAGKYKCSKLLYWERFQYVREAVAREKEIKGWLRKKKEVLIATLNPGWKFLNDEIGLP
ncbi:MAG: GIY-YIG nuclease family protein [Roseivirga sp.]